MVRNRGEIIRRKPTAVLLAGAIQPPPLRRGLGVPLLSLPLGHGRVLLDTWLDALVESEAIERVLVLVNTPHDASHLQSITPKSVDLSVEIIPEQAHWRGSAGLLRDAAERLHADAIIGIEAHRLPPQSLEPLTDRAQRDDLDAIVGVTERTDESAGVYYFSSDALKFVPPVGYLDLKEQFLPTLRRKGVAIWPVTLRRGQFRIRDRAGYLRAVHAMLKHDDQHDGTPWIAPTAAVSSGARIEGSSIVDRGAKIECGAIVYQSVVMQGAVIKAGAIVSRAVVGRRVEVARGARIIDQTVQ